MEENIKKIILDFTYHKGKTQMDQLFEELIPILEYKINKAMDSKIIYHTKKRKMVNNFLNAFYGMLDEGGKCKSIKKKYGLSKSCYYGYIEVCNRFQIFDNLHFQLLNLFNSYITQDAITDTFTIRAKGAFDSKGYHYKEPNKPGTSVSVISDLNKIPLAYYTDAGNIDDREMLWMNLGDPDAQIRTIDRIFADKGYIGKQFEKIISTDHKAKIICPPKRTRGKSMTHKLEPQDSKDLKKYRNRIEHVNSRMRNFRLIDVRYNKKIRVFDNYLALANLLTAIMQLKKTIPGLTNYCSYKYLNIFMDKNYSFKILRFV